MSEAFFRAATAVTCLIAFGMSAYFRTRAQLKGGKLRSATGQRSLVVLRLGGLAMIVPVIVYMIAPEWVQWARVPLPAWLRLAALGVGLVNSVLVFWMYRSLDTNVSPVEEARTTAMLVTHGPYRWIRHPLYTFGIVAMVSLTFLTGLWWVGALTVPLAIFFVMWRIPREEAKLIEVFGERYLSYMKLTGRMLPRLSGAHA